MFAPAKPVATYVAVKNGRQNRAETLGQQQASNLTSLLISRCRTYRWRHMERLHSLYRFTTVVVQTRRFRHLAGKDIIRLFCRSLR